MAKLVFSFEYAEDDLLQLFTAAYVDAVKRTEVMFDKAKVDDTAIAQRTWLKLKETFLEGIENIFNGMVVNGWAVVRRPDDTADSLRQRVKEGIRGAVIDAFKRRLDFDAGLFPEDISTSYARRFELIPRHDDPDDSKMTYRNIIPAGAIETWWLEIDQIIDGLMGHLVTWVDHYIELLMTMPQGTTFEMGANPRPEDRFYLYIPDRR